MPFAVSMECAMSSSGVSLVSAAELAVSSEVGVRAVGRAEFPRLLALVQAHAAQRPDRTAFGAARASLLEFEEALFEPPFSAWAWIATRDGEDVGYAAASVGFSVLERGHYLCLEALHVSVARSGAERRLLRTAQDWARELGCVNLQWRVAAAERDVLRTVAPHGLHVVDGVQLVLPMPG
jgi:GNAT superfamily N-acetyltransferase